MFLVLFCQMMKRSDDEALRLRWIHTYARTHHQKCAVTEMDLADKVKSLSGTLSQLSKGASFL